MRVHLSARRSAISLLLAGIALNGLAVPELLGHQFWKPIGQRAANTSRRLLLQQVRVKPEMMDEFVYLERHETVPALQKAGVSWREVYQTATVGRTGLFAFLSEISGMEQLDAASPLERVLGDGYANYQRRLRSMIQESQTSIVRARPDLGMAPVARLSPRLAVVARMQVQPGRQGQFESWIKTEYLPVVRRSNCRAYWVSQTLLGGASGEYWSFTYGDSFAEFDSSPMMQVLGSDGADALSTRAGVFLAQVERWVVRYREDLSFELPPGRRGVE